MESGAPVNGKLLFQAPFWFHFVTFRMPFSMILCSCFCVLVSDFLAFLFSCLLAFFCFYSFVRPNKPCTLFRPGVMRASRFNPPPPFRGPGVLDTTSILPISSFSAPRTLRRASAYFAPKSQNLNFSCFSTVFCPFKNPSNFDLFSKPPKITKIGARAQYGWIWVDFQCHFGYHFWSIFTTRLNLLFRNKHGTIVFDIQKPPIFNQNSSYFFCFF